jgi:putative phosphoribosyl transferase
LTPPPASQALFASRAAAGATLGGLLYRRVPPPAVVVGVTPSGVEIAAHAARALGASFDVAVASFVRMGDLGIIGAVAEDADAELDSSFQPRFGVMGALSEAIDRARRAVKTERLLYRGHRPLRTVEDANVVVVEGPLASPWKALAAARALGAMGAARIVLAAPTATEAARDALAARRFEFVCPHVVAETGGHPRPFSERDDPSAERLRSIVVARDAA